MEFIMISRRDTIKNPFLRKYIVTSIYRRLLKEKNKSFDNKITQMIEAFIISFKNEKKSFSYQKYTKVIKSAEYFQNALETSNQRNLTAISLKSSKDLLKISYGTKPQPKWIPTSETRIKKTIDKIEIFEKVQKFESKSHEFIAYRMAFAIPSQFTKSEHNLMNPPKHSINL